MIPYGDAIPLGWRLASVDDVQKYQQEAENTIKKGQKWTIASLSDACSRCTFGPRAQ